MTPDIAVMAPQRHSGMWDFVVVLIGEASALALFLPQTNGEPHIYAASASDDPADAAHTLSQDPAPAVAL